jgi:hypothetical protein
MREKYEIKRKGTTKREKKHRDENITKRIKNFRVGGIKQRYKIMRREKKDKDRTRVLNNSNCRVPVN